MDTNPNSSHQTTLQLKIDWRVVSGALLIIILGLLMLWQPWHARTSAKTISVRGEATVSQVPDSYIFTPIFEAADSKTVTEKGNEAVAGLKKLGVTDAQIKTSANAYDTKPMPMIYPSYPNGVASTFSITVTVKDKALAQKIADYLATTSATGQVTPYASLSKDARSALELKARSKASDDAKAKAGVMAKELGAKLGKVVSVSESSNVYLPMEAQGLSKANDSSAAGSTTSGPIVEPGTDEVTYSATVVFELK
jgi:uncharacterized protein YggE